MLHMLTEKTISSTIETGIYSLHTAGLEHVLNI